MRDFTNFTWKKSKKGNPYTQIGHNNIVIIKVAEKYSFLINYEYDNYKTFDTEATAKEAALRFFFANCK